MKKTDRVFQPLWNNEKQNKGNNNQKSKKGMNESSWHVLIKSRECVIFNHLYIKLHEREDFVQ